MVISQLVKKGADVNGTRRRVWMPDIADPPTVGAPPVAMMADSDSSAMVGLHRVTASVFCIFLKKLSATNCSGEATPPKR